MTGEIRIFPSLDSGSFIPVVYRELDRLLRNPYVTPGIHLILPGVTLSAPAAFRGPFWSKALELRCCWHDDLRRRIGHRGIRSLRWSLPKTQRSLVFEGLWVEGNSILNRFAEEEVDRISGERSGRGSDDHARTCSP